MNSASPSCSFGVERSRLGDRSAPRLPRRARVPSGCRSRLPSPPVREPWPTAPRQANQCRASTSGCGGSRVPDVRRWRSRTAGARPTRGVAHRPPRTRPAASSSAVLDHARGPSATVSCRRALGYSSSSKARGRDRARPSISASTDSAAIARRRPGAALRSRLTSSNPLRRGLRSRLAAPVAPCGGRVVATRRPGGSARRKRGGSRRRRGSGRPGAVHRLGIGLHRDLGVGVERERRRTGREDACESRSGSSSDGVPPPK